MRRSRLVVQHVITGLQAGGAERMLERIVRCTSDRFEHRVLTLTDGGAMREPLQAAGASLSSLQARSISLPLVLSRLVRFELAESDDVDVFSGWLHHGNVAAAALALGARKPYVVNFRSSLEYDLGRPVMRALRIASLGATKRITNSHETATESRRHRFGECIVVPNGFPGDEFDIGRGDGANDAVLTFGTLGRHHPVKRQELFIETLSGLMRTHPFIRGLVVGRGVEASLSGMIPLDLRERWSLEEETQDVAKALARMDVFVQSSISEGFPNAVAEAMLARAVVAATDVGETRLFLGAGNRVFPANDVRAMTSALRSVASTPKAALQRIGDGNRALVLSMFDEREVARRFMAEFDFARAMARRA
jgi:glycosyltransferase involved in cell wall biosynthesis